LTYNIIPLTTKAGTLLEIFFYRMNFPAKCEPILFVDLTEAWSKIIGFP
jgi:hypothetical protein